MQILTHLCCGPCTAYPLRTMREQGHSIQGFFFNPNIHPYREFKQRITALEALAEKMGLEVEYEREYGLTEYLRRVVFHEEQRCRLCYTMRLEATAAKAKQIGADAFTSTLLYSRYQQHGAIKTIGESLARQYAIPFYYQDFREGWQRGIDMAKAMDLYRQPYCGCIYSEQERYDKKFRKGKK
ncbi:MAG: epoxyqueuosine reductase QueH [Desulfobulbaceae bacterium]|nr:epoxyqueuosine reductase QueH [Desulfobulbaceae bacterium]HIJ78578.1 epoxyqueuosine reductase QueH [Deltaproteobacteria bacterium]